MIYIYIYVKYPIEHPICQRFLWAKYKRCLKRINGMKNMKTTSTSEAKALRAPTNSGHSVQYVPIMYTYNWYVVNMQILCNSIVTCQLISLWTSHHFIIQATIAPGARWVWTVNRLTQTKNSLDRQATWKATPEVAVDGRFGNSARKPPVDV